MVRLLLEAESVKEVHHKSFNPTMVRLLPLIYLDPPYVHETVSIPQWCDCCLNPLDNDRLNLLVSIPQWCDCCLICVRSWKLRRLVSIPQWCDCCRKDSPHALFCRTKFQSHNGAIAAGVVNDCACQPNWFQSHNGAIAADKAFFRFI